MGATIDITIQIPSLPEGWQGSVDDLLEFIQDNAIFQLDGQAPSIQIGGSKPTQNVGIYFTPDSVEYFQNGKYSPITDVPIGCCLPWAGGGGNIPTNYLLCDGSSKLQSDYPDLFAVIGLTYGPSGSTTNFNVPDCRGRAVIGAGTGVYDINTTDTASGNMIPVAVGGYQGSEWIKIHSIKPPGAPTTVTSFSSNDTIKALGGSNFSKTTDPSVGMQWIIRCF